MKGIVGLAWSLNLHGLETLEIAEIAANQASMQMNSQGAKCCLIACAGNNLASLPGDVELLRRSKPNVFDQSSYLRELHRRRLTGSSLLNTLDMFYRCVFLTRRVAKVYFPRNSDVDELHLVRRACRDLQVLTEELSLYWREEFQDPYRHQNVGLVSF